jgi:drug/metabolite transporter (DMT)-like permease
MSDSPARLWIGLALSAGVCAISASALLVRLAEAPGISTATARTMISAALMLAITLGRGGGARLMATSRKELLLCALSGLFLGLHFWAWMTSLSYTTVASSVLFVTLNPIFLALAAPWVTKDPGSRRLWLGIALAVLGSLVVGWDDLRQGPSTSLYGNGLALLGSVCASGYLLAGRLARRTVPLDAYATLTNAAACLTLLPPLLLGGAPFASLPPKTWGVFLLLAVVPQLIGHNSLVWALRHVSAPLVSVAILAEPLGSGVLAWYFLHEAPTPLKLVGAAVLLAGILLASLDPQKKGEAA